MILSIATQLLLQLDHQRKWQLYLLSFQLYNTVSFDEMFRFAFEETLKTVHKSTP